MIKRKLLVIFAALAMLLTFAPVVSASYWSLKTSSCSGYMVSNSACFKEHTGGGGDIILLIQGSPTYIEYLEGVATPSGTQCAGYPFASPNWNDCISWFRYNISSGYKLCLFYDANHQNLMYRRDGPASGSVDWGNTGYNDRASSIYLVPVGNGNC